MDDANIDVTCSAVPNCQRLQRPVATAKVLATGLPKRPEVTQRPIVRALRIAIHDYAGHPFQFDLSRALARRGHEVRHFFFGGDSGPKGVTTVSDSDPASFSIEPINIKLPYSKKRFVVRLLGDYLYGFEAGRCLRRFLPDVVISGNTPLDSQWGLKRAADRSGVPFVFWVHEFHSLAIERSFCGRWGGFGTVIAKWYRRRETILLGASAAIVLISPDFRRHLPASLGACGAVHVIRNWGALDLISPRPHANAWRTRMQLNGKLVIMYTGTLALKHDPKLLLALSDSFAERDDVVIVVVAAGVNAEVLKSANREQPRKNLVLLPLQSATDLPNVLATADVLLAFLESDAAEFCVPSKLLSYLCAGRAIVLSAPAQNLSVRVLTESGGGVAVPAGDVAAFVDAVHSLVLDDNRRHACGCASRSYAEQHFQIGEISMQFEAIFEAALRQSGKGTRVMCAT